MAVKLEYQVANENAIIVYIDVDNTSQLTQTIAAFCEIIQSKLSSLVIGLIPAYRSILISFDIKETHHEHLYQQVLSLAETLSLENNLVGKLVTLPVYYDENVGIDLVDVARAAGLSIDDVISIHQTTEYQVRAIGFAPGFAYLGDVDERISCPRLSTPRQSVPKGAVAIADNHTAIYPQSSPGGWNIIGLCPTQLFTPESSTPLIFDVGDRVKFEAISQQEFITLGGEIPFTGKTSDNGVSK